MHKILVLEDCPEVAQLIQLALPRYDVVFTDSIQSARSLLAVHSISLFLLDVNLPDGSGFDFCQELSNLPQYMRTPKIILTAEESIPQKVYGFSCGADDYMTKPFSQQELQARVDAKLRNVVDSVVEKVFGFQFDSNFQRCFVEKDGCVEDLNLTPTEYRLFHVMVKKANSPLERGELVRAVWKACGVNVESRGIDSHISHLRKKLGSRGKEIVSVYGRGYAYKSTLDSNMP